ncbi:MAG: hypothetical protein M3145_05870, partial [Pseudomonadota bacterium]|nr:hypothetical protein [Pseudomonadota bacterium]
PAMRRGVPTVQASGGRQGANADDDDRGKGGERKEDIETENIFGFTEGSDTVKAGEKELANDLRGRFGKRHAVRIIEQEAEHEDDPPPPPIIVAPRGSYVAFNNVTELEYGITDNLRFALGVASAYYYVRNIFELENRNNGGFDGLSTEFKWRLLERGPSPIGLAIAVEPEWRRFEETSGAPATVVSLGLKLQADAALIPDVLFAALNLIYEPEASKQRGGGRFEFEDDEGTLTFEPFRWERESSLEASGALAARVTETIFLGAELRYLTTYEGLFFREFEGRALFVGPTFFAKLSEHAFVKAAWSVQVAGKAAEDPGHDLDLVNYERHQVRVKFGVNF